MVKIRIPLLPSSVRLGGVVLVAAGILYYSTVATLSGAVSVGSGGATSSGGGGLTATHVLGYAVLAWSLAYADAAPGGREAVAWKRALAVIAIVSAYGLVIEVVQLGFPERVFDPADMLSNAVGAATVIGWYVIEPWLEFVPLGDEE